MKSNLKSVDIKRLARRKRNLKTLKMVMVILDILSLILLVMQMITKDITYWSYFVLVICNVLVFVTKIDEKNLAKNS